MKTRWMIVLGLVLLSVSCEPFLFSTFPGYVTDAVAITDIGAFLGRAGIQRFDFFALNNGAEEYAFLLATGYDGSKTLLVFSPDLALVTSFSSPVFGSRHFVSAAGDFVVGGCYIVKGISPTSTVSTIPNNVFGSDGNGGALFYSGSLVNVLLRAGGTSLNAQAYTQATPWNTISPNPGSADIGGNGLGYNLVYEGRLFNIPSGALGSPGPASYLGFCEFDNWPNRGYLLVLVDAQYGNYNSPAPLLAPSPPGRYVIPLGEVAGDNTPMFVVRDGIVVRGADGNMRFYGWDGQLKGTTRDDGASGRVYLDFSPVDYYYVFDPSSLKLYKARNWWQKN